MSSETETEFDGCPLNKYGCKGGCEWQCPACLHIVQHQQFCPACMLGFCSLCLGAGWIEDNSYYWHSPRRVRCPGC
jgi:hypothetical protein